MSPKKAMTELPPIYELMMYRCATEDITDGELRQLAVLALIEIGKGADEAQFPLVQAAVRRVAADTDVNDLRRLFDLPPRPLQTLTYAVEGG